MSNQPLPFAQLGIFNPANYAGRGIQSVDFPVAQGTVTMSNGITFGDGTYMNSSNTYEAASVISAVGDVYTLATNLGNGSKVHVVGGMDGTAASSGTGPSFNLYGTINSTGTTVWDSTLSSGNISIGASAADGGSIYIERTGGGGAVTVSATIKVNS